jgi:hypothetical protein
MTSIFSPSQNIIGSWNLTSLLCPHPSVTFGHICWLYRLWEEYNVPVQTVELHLSLIWWLYLLATQFLFDGQPQLVDLVFWVVKPCGLVGRYQCFSETYCLHLQPWRYLPTRPHGITAQKTNIDIFTTVSTSISTSISSEVWTYLCSSSARKATFHLKIMLYFLRYPWRLHAEHHKLSSDNIIHYACTKKVHNN